MTRSIPVTRSKHAAGDRREEGRPSSDRATKRALNVRFLIGTLVVVAVLGGSGYGWHCYQSIAVADAVWEHANGLAAKARSLEEKGETDEAVKEWQKAASNYHRFLRARPGDVEATILLAEAYDKSGRNWSQAVRYYRNALAVAPEDRAIALRTRLAELLVQGGQFGQANREVEKLPEDPAGIPKSAAGKRLGALARFGLYGSGAVVPGSGEGPELDKAFDLAVKGNPNDIQLAWILATHIYRGDRKLLSAELQKELRSTAELHKRFIEAKAKNADADLLEQLLDKLVKELLNQEADKVIDQMVESNEKSPEALLVRYRYRMHYTVPASIAAEKDTREALKLARTDDKGDLRTVLAEAVAASQNALKDAEKDLQLALERGPDDVNVCMTAARHASSKAQQEGVARETAKTYYDQACAHYEHIIDNVDSSATAAYLGLGDVRHVQGEKILAIKKWREGLENGRKNEPLVFLDLHSRLAGALIARNELYKADNILSDDHLEEARVALEKFKLAVRRIPARATKKTDKTYKLALQNTLDLLEGKWYLQMDDPLSAIPLLERAANTIPSLKDAANAKENDAQAFRVWTLLGRVREGLQQWDHAATACERAVELNPKAAAPCLAAAQACRRAGRPDAAVRYYQMAEGLENTPETMLALALALFQHQTGLPADERQWDAFDDALDDAKSAAKDETLKASWRVTLLEAGYVAMRGKETNDQEQAYTEAAKLYRKAEEEFPDSLPMLQRLVPAYEQLGRSADADRVMEKAAQLTDQPGAALLMKSQLLAQRKQYKQAQEELGKALKKLPEPKRFAVRMAQVQLYLRQGKPKEALEVLSGLYKTYSERYDNLSKDRKPTIDIQRDRAATRQKLVDVARQAADVASSLGVYKLVNPFDAKSDDKRYWDTWLEEHEGPDGSHWRYYRARRLLAQSKKTGDSEFIDASSLLDELRNRRPEWHATHLLDALVLERRGSHREAIDSYEKAIRAGERRIGVIKRVIGLLCAMRRFDEADRYLAKLKDGADDPADLSRLEIVIAEGRDDPERAVKAARRLAEQRPDDPDARITLGHALMKNDQTEAAEAEYQLALKMAPERAEPYAALFDYYRRAKQLDRALETLEQLGTLEKLSETERALQLAPRYWLLGDDEQAEDNYRKAVKEAKDDYDDNYDKAGKKPTRDSAIHAQLVSARAQLAFFLTSARNFDEAEKVLRDLLKLEPNHDASRRRLALVLAARGGEKQWQEARKMLKQTGSDDLDEEDLRLEAALLEKRGGSENLKEARRILEGLIADARTPQPRDRLLLARVYEAEDKVLAARDQLLALAGGDDPQPQHLVAYVDFLLRNNGANEAGGWIDRIEEVTASTNWPTVSLRARWLHTQDRADEIQNLVEPAVKELLETIGADEQQQTQLALAVGDIYSQVELDPAAEGWYRRVYAAAPDNYEPLITSLVRQRRMAEAIEVCNEAAASDSSSRPVVILARALSLGKPSAEDSQLAEPLLAEALEEYQGDVALLLNLANFRIAQQRILDAIGLYKEILKVDANHLLALNNLATLLSEQLEPGKCKEAMKYIDRAISVAGEQPSFLDTKGMIYLYDGKPEKALKCLETAVNSPDLDPRYFFHLAVAYQRVGEPDKARGALKKAHDDGLTRQILTDRDREWIEELEGKL